ncbi:MAG TPA: phosphomethylpyrimidine synthase ThiC, partial [Spirochaetota bacterium]|nr:phosphomethylpyrimidine synthase ThiC [Spirochaetota bacterium]
MTQMEYAKSGKISDEMLKVAETEPLTGEEVRKSIADGTMVILKSKIHDCLPVGIGKGLKIKINANLGTSNFNADP